MDNEVWDAASVTFPDWKGTVQLDQRMTGSWNLYKAIGLDDKKWQLLGFDIHSGEDGRRFMCVYATPTDAWDNEKKDATVDVEVTEFQVYDVDPFEILERMTHVFDLRMRLRHLENRRIVIRSRANLPHGKFEDDLFEQKLDGWTFAHGVTGNTRDFGSRILGSNPGERAVSQNCAVCIPLQFNGKTCDC